MAKILIIDDYALVRAGIAAMLFDLEPGVETAEASMCDEAIELAVAAQSRGAPFDWALLDLNLPGFAGFEALVKFRDLLPDLPIVVVSGREDPASVLQALELGAKSFLPKSAVPNVIRSALAALLRGEVFVPPASFSAGPESVPLGAKDPQLPQDFGQLTERQLEVLGLVVQGHSNKVIARKLNIVEATVKIHVSAVLRC